MNEEEIKEVKLNVLQDIKTLFVRCYKYKKSNNALFDKMCFDDGKFEKELLKMIKEVKEAREIGKIGDYIRK